jgi:hypothetical protein
MLPPIYLHVYTSPQPPPPHSLLTLYWAPAGDEIWFSTTQIFHYFSRKSFEGWLANVDRDKRTPGYVYVCMHVCRDVIESTMNIALTL